MKSAVENLSATRVKVTCEVPADELKPSLDAAYGRIAASVNIPGFRKGKVPARVIDQRFGKGAVLEEAVNDALPRAIAEVIVENKLTQMSRPEVDVTKVSEEEGIAFTAEFDIRPEFEVPNLAELKVVVDPAEVTEEQVEEQLTALRSRFGALKPVDRAAADGDLIMIDLRGSQDGQEVQDLSANALSYELGSDGMVPGFDEAVRGAKADEVRTFEFTPEFGEFAGKSVEVEVTVKAVRERELPAADDEFAQLASEFDTIAQLRDDIRERLGRVRLVEQAYQAREAAHESLIGAITAEVPEHAVKDEVDSHFQDGHGDEAHRAEFEANAVKGVKSRMVLDKIAEAEDLQVADAELSQWLVAEAQRYGMAPDEFADQLVKAGQVNAAIAEVRRAKALSFVLEAVTVVDRTGAVIDLESVLKGQAS